MRGLLILDRQDVLVLPYTTNCTTRLTEIYKGTPQRKNVACVMLKLIAITHLNVKVIKGKALHRVVLPEHSRKVYSILLHSNVLRPGFVYSMNQEIGLP